MSDAVHITPPEVTPMPEGGAEKFYDEKTGAYDWQSHAKEAEFKLSQKAPAADSAPAEGDDEAAKAAEAEAAAKKAAEEAAEAGDLPTAEELDWDQIDQRIAENDGEVPDDIREALNAIGVPDATIDAHMEGLRAQLELHIKSVHDMVGGEAEWDRMTAWLRDNIDEKQRKFYNEALLDADRVEGTVRTLKNLVPPAAKKGDPVDTANSNTGNGGDVEVQGYKDQNELNLAIQNPLYRKHTAEGAAYRAEVQRKAAASTFEVNVRAHTAGR